MTEDEAIQRCQDGEREAFRPLVERHQDVVFGTAYHMTGSPALAEELAQEAFLAAWQGIRGFRLGRPFKPWLMRILVNTVLAQRRKRSVETTPIEASGVAGDARTTPRPWSRPRWSGSDCSRPLTGCHQSIGRWWCCGTSPS